MNLIKLKVLGLSYSQTQSGTYALVLSAEGTNQRIPIIIGGFEAQAIAIQLEDLTPPRPLTHDLFLSFSERYKVGLRHAIIYKLEEGVFFSRLVFEKDNNVTEIDSRTSDAVALALRFSAPIYTTQDIISKAGIIIKLEDEEDADEESPENSETPPTYSKGSKLKNKTKAELNEMIQDAIDREAYEEASKIRDELERRKKE